jgi:hypothetical protein
MLLESRSLRLALARYHLTTARALGSGEGAKDEAAVLSAQLNVLAELDKVDFDRFTSFADVLSAAAQEVPLPDQATGAPGAGA